MQDQECRNPQAFCFGGTPETDLSGQFLVLRAER